MTDEFKKRPIYRDPSSAGPDQVRPVNSLPKTEYRQSQHSNTSNSNRNAIKENWMQHLVAAKIKWGKLTEAELINSEGNHSELIELVRIRYSISRHEANDQVSNFFNKNESAFTILA